MRKRFRPLRGIGDAVRKKRAAKAREDARTASKELMKLLAMHGGRHPDVIRADEGLTRSDFIAVRAIGDIPRGTRVRDDDFRDFMEDLRYRR